MKSKIFFLLMVAFAATLTVSTGCRVMLIGAYDEVTDQGIQKIQTDVSALLITLKKNLINNNPPGNAYTNFDKSYTIIESEIESLDIRCRSLPKYTIINKQISILKRSVLDLEALHKFPNAFSRIGDTTQINSNQSTLEVAFSAMIALQNGLKSVKTN